MSLTAPQQANIIRSQRINARRHKVLHPCDRLLLLFLFLPFPPLFTRLCTVKLQIFNTTAPLTNALALIRIHSIANIHNLCTITLTFIALSFVTLQKHYTRAAIIIALLL